MTGSQTRASKVAVAGREFSGFVLVGGIAAGVNWGSRILLSGFGMSLSLAVVIAYLIGMGVAYTLSRHYVFPTSGRTVRSEMLRFALVNLVSLPQVWGVTLLMDRSVLPGLGWTWNQEAVAHALGVAAPVFTSYLGHRFFTFGAARDVDGAKTDKLGGSKSDDASC